MPPAHEDLLRYAKYPFMGGAGECVKGMGVDLSSLVSDRAYETARMLGVERVASAVRDGRINPPVLSSNAAMIEELLSYPIARMLVSCVGDKYVIKRYALAEAERARQILLDEKPEDFSCILELAEELGVDAKTSGHNDFSLFFTDYLKNTVQLKSKDWKLVNQEWFGRGRVLLSKERFTRVLQNVIQLSIESSLPLEVNDVISKAFGEQARMLKEEAATRRKKFEASDIGRVSVTHLPPCMKQLLSRMQSGENLPHSGRFAITAFLHCLGMSTEDILKAFSLSPDFKESMARYQIEHISGGGTGTEYTPPGCSTMKTYGLCPGEDDICAREWMDHPLKYYRYKDRRAKKFTSHNKEKKGAVGVVGGVGSGEKGENGNGEDGQSKDMGVDSDIGDKRVEEASSKKGQGDSKDIQEGSQ